MVEVHDWRTTADPGQIIATAVNALAAGQLVVLPTDAGYHLAASALSPAAVERLAGPELVMALRGADELDDWVVRLNGRLRRLLRRCWPGPVILAANEGWDRGLAQRLPPSVRHRLCSGGRLDFVVCRHESMAAILRCLPGPLLLSAIPGTNGEVSDRLEELLPALDNLAALVLRDEPSRGRSVPTVVQPDGEGWRILREGVVPAAALDRLSCRILLFVCTGNTCRSPLAEALCKKMLADRLACTVAELPQRGFLVLSAGLSAMMGAEAAPEAVEIAREFGADLTEHASRPLTEDLAAQADCLLVMTRSHLRALVDYFPRLGTDPRLLSPQGEDVADPIGAGLEVYRDCAGQIRGYVDRLLVEVLQP